MDDVCFECGGQAEFNHHVVPKSKGGTKTVKLCAKCHGDAHYSGMSRSSLTRDALKMKKIRHERVGGVPYGYRLSCNGVNIEPCNEEIEAIIEAKVLHNLGFSLRKIGAELKRQGYLSRSGKTYLAVQVKRLLASDFCSGGGLQPIIFTLTSSLDMPL